MNQLKRKLSFNRSPNEEIKNFQCNFEQDMRSITSIESFSNEFFYEIFDYLDGCKIYHAFANLNHRFEQVLISSLLLFKISSNNQLSKEIFPDICKRMMQFNKHQISSLYFNMSSSINQFFSSVSFDSSFNRLESLFLYEPQSNIVIPLLLSLRYLPRLFSLTLYILHGLTDLADVYRIVLRLPMLKYHNLVTDHSDLLASLPVNTDQQFSTLKHLDIENHCTFNDVLAIMSYTPQLNRLNYTDTNSSDFTIEILSPITLSNLTHLYISVYGAQFDVFEMFIKKIDSKLKVLSFTIQHEYIAYLDANRWEQLILKYLPQLEKFYFRYYASFVRDSDIHMYRGGPNQFTSSFWIERQWIFAVQNDPEDFIFSIRPYEKRWYESIQDEIVNSSPELSKSTQLTLIYISSNEWQGIITQDIKLVLIVAQIYHLVIPVEETYIGILITLINLLPELLSLKIHSLSFDKPEDINTEDIEILPSTKRTSKITKVYLEELNRTEEIYFLTALCPSMTYFKVDLIKNNMDAETLLRNISEKMNLEHNDRIRPLCFRGPAANKK